MTDILARICDDKKVHVQKRKRERSESSLLADIKDLPAPFGFIEELTIASEDGYGLIAEIKRASPSKGMIRVDFHPQHFAEAYEKGGATCLSILTDEPYFKGKDEYLEMVKEISPLPCLRKDFMLEPYQIIESRVLGADCILLIMAALSDAQAAELFAAAESLALDVLVEVHDGVELERALKHVPVKMIGINNRNLKTFETSLEISETLAKYLPDSILAVSESGIYAHGDLKRLEQSGIRNFLVGESLMREVDLEAATRRLLGG